MGDQTSFVEARCEEIAQIRQAEESKIDNQIKASSEDIVKLEQILQFKKEDHVFLTS